MMTRLTSSCSAPCSFCQWLNISFPPLDTRVRMIRTIRMSRVIRTIRIVSMIRMMIMIRIQ